MPSSSMRAPVERPFLRRIAIGLARILWRAPLMGFLRRDGLLEHALCCRLVPERMALPRLPLERAFPGATEARVELKGLPDGDWQTPLGDLVALLKLVMVAAPRRVLELGSYRGWTAAYIAQHLPDTSVVAVDISPEHGEAYRGTPLARRIERRVGAITPALFEQDPPGSFDFIFIDSDHRYSGVENDTRIALRLVAPGGIIAWHDYSNYGYFNGICQVPDYLASLQEGGMTLTHIEGTAIAFHRAAGGR